MLELALKDIANENFSSAMKFLLEKELDMGVAVNLARSVEKLEKELKHFMTVRDELIKKFGKPVLDQDGKPTETFTMAGVTPENIKLFNDKYEELLETKVELPLTEKVKLSKSKDGKMKTVHMLALVNVVDVVD